MSVADNYLKIRTVLDDGPLSPAELRAATGLSRHQIYRASLLGSDLAFEDRTVPVVIYSTQHNLYILTNNGVEMARALLPRIKQMITMCDNTLPILNVVLENNPDNEGLLEAKETFEEHKRVAMEQKAQLEKLIEEAP